VGTTKEKDIDSGEMVIEKQIIANLPSIRHNDCICSGRVTSFLLTARIYGIGDRIDRLEKGYESLRLNIQHHNLSSTTGFTNRLAINSIDRTAS
jgi:hypothetical protein